VSTSEDESVAWISLNTAVSISGLSKRTLWRHIESGALAALRPTDPGGCTRVRAADLLTVCALDRVDEPLLMAADQGEPSAQRDLGLLLIEQGRTETGLAFLKLAARQGDAHALYRLGRDQLCRTLNPDERENALLNLYHAGLKGHGLALSVSHWLQAPAGQEALHQAEANLALATLAKSIDDIERDTLLRSLADTAATERDLSP